MLDRVRIPSVGRVLLRERVHQHVRVWSGERFLKNADLARVLEWASGRQPEIVESPHTRAHSRMRRSAAEYRRHLAPPRPAYPSPGPSRSPDKKERNSG